MMIITIPTRCANVRPIVPVPQHISNSSVSGPKHDQSPASEYNFSAARVLTCSRSRLKIPYTRGKNSLQNSAKKLLLF